MGIHKTRDKRASVKITTPLMIEVTNLYSFKGGFDMKILLIMLAVAIVMTLVVLLSWHMGLTMGTAVWISVIEDALDKEVIPDIDIDEEKIKAYSPNNADVQMLFKENMHLLLKEHILMKYLMKFKIKR